MSVRTLAKNALSSSTQVVLSALVLFELYRFLTRHLGIDEIGLWSLVMASTAVVRLSEFGLGACVVKFVANDLGKGDSRLAARTVAIGAQLVALFASVVCIALYPALQVALAHAVPQTAVAASHALLPYALAALVAASVGNVFLSSLDGCQRSDLRTVIQVGAALVQLGAAYALVPTNGLEALGLVQLIQASSLLVGSAALTVFEFRQPIAAWLCWDGKRTRELIRYGGGIQVAAIGQLLFEPTVKVFLTAFDGLTLTGYYEMANRMMLQFRAVIVSGYSMLVPYVAGYTTQPGAAVIDIRRIYLSACRLLVTLVAPYFGLIGIALPILLTLWLGRFEWQFIAVAALCWLGWALNTMISPAYFLYLATGRVQPTVWCQITIGSLNALLAGAGGWFWGGYGVLAGSTMALVAGSCVVVIAFHIEYHISACELLPRQSIELVTFCLLVVAAILGLAHRWGGSDKWMVMLVPCVLFLGLMIVTLTWRHPLRADLMLRLLPQWRRGF